MHLCVLQRSNGYCWLFAESASSSPAAVSASDIASITSGMQKLRHYRRRNRTKFTPHQIRELEKAFEKTQYPDVLTREELGERLDISESRIQVSFLCKPFQWPSPDSLGLVQDIKHCSGAFTSSIDLRNSPRSWSNLVKHEFCSWIYFDTRFFFHKTSGSIHRLKVIFPDFRKMIFHPSACKLVWSTFFSKSFRNSTLG